MEYWSLGVFSPTNPIRRAAQRLVSSSKFESLILLCIFVNCLFLAMAEPAVAPDYSSDPTMDALLRGADYVFTCIFGVEMVCKLVALGLACHAGPSHSCAGSSAAPVHVLSVCDIGQPSNSAVWGV